LASTAPTPPPIIKSSSTVLARPNYTSLFSNYKFSQFDLDKILRENLAGMGVIVPTSIQCRSFVPISSGKDSVLCSETGSGKTLAYLVPLFNRVLYQKQIDEESSSNASGWRDILGRARAPIVVVCPTVELCKQLIDVATQLDKDGRLIKQWLASSSFSPSDDVIASPRIRWGAVDLVVTTPSKFVDDMKRFSEENLKPSTIIFDEADLLFHGPTQAHVLDIIGYLRPRISHGQDKVEGGETSARQSLCQFISSSATLPSIGPFSIGSMIGQRFSTAEIIRTGNFHGVPECIREINWIEESNGNWDERCYLLARVLAKPVEEEGKKVIVFVNSTTNCELLYKFLMSKKWPVSKFCRKNNSSRDGQVLMTEKVLVATDLAARGIDWEGIDMVINFQMPRDIVTWIHRAGRCGRMGKSGSVLTFYKQSESELVGEIRTKLMRKMDESFLVNSERSSGDLSSLFSKKRSLKRLMRAKRASSAASVDRQ